MKLRSFFSILIAGVLALLALSVGGFYWLTAHTPLNLLQGGPTGTPAAAIFVPKSAPAMLSMLVNPDRLEALRQVFAPPQERQRSHAEFNQIKKSLLFNTGLDYSRDIEPWLGEEITFAVTGTDFDRDRSNGKQVGILLAVASNNVERSREFLELFWQKPTVAGEDVVVEQYKGVKLTYRKAKSSSDFSPLSSGISSSFATAVVGSSSTNRDSFVLFANHPKVLREAINNVQASNLSLNNAAEYQQVFKELKQGRIAVGFANISELNDWIGTKKTVSNEEKESSTTSPATLAIALGVNRQGLLAEAVVVSPDSKDVLSTSPQSEPVKALNYVPAASPFVAASRDLNHLWNQLSTGVGSNDVLSKLVNQPIADLKVSWGIDLAKDIFSWVRGEYALALLPRPDRSGADWIFAAEKSPDSEKAIARLDAIAQSQDYSIGNFSLNNQKISAWTRLTTSSNLDRKNTAIKAEAKGVRATVGEYEIFTTSVEAMDESLKASQIGNVASNSDFQTAIAPLPQLNHGYLYLDWPSSRAVWERQIPLLRLIELSGRPFFDHLRSITLTSTGGEAGIRRGSAFIRLN
ncbi:MAG TPA: DUF3352 domain-containing protein [Kamptonema sp.]|nr:DUF3352 domain-containing protein [Kamptonema sp.]